MVMVNETAVRQVFASARRGNKTALSQVMRMAVTPDHPFRKEAEDLLVELGLLPPKE